MVARTEDDDQLASVVGRVWGLSCSIQYQESRCENFRSRCDYICRDLGWTGVQEAPKQSLRFCTQTGLHWVLAAK